MGDHTEAISIDYDPALTSYEELLNLFWKGHRCESVNRSTQYKNAIFYRDEAQREMALESRRQQAGHLGIAVEKIRTEVSPVNHFTYAERYHQKYSLSRKSEVRLFLEEVYPTSQQLADSAVATRLNAYLGSGMKRDWAALLSELPDYGLPSSLEARLSKRAQDRLS